MTSHRSAIRTFLWCEAHGPGTRISNDLMDRIRQDWYAFREQAEALGFDATEHRATAIDPASLPPPQARMARWLASTYKVAPEPVAALVREAHLVGPRLKLQPTMILAVMATESSLNPFSESSAGAQGLMQVMPKVHARRFEEHGGPMTAFDPLTNLRVGARVLHDCIKLTGGSVEDGLRFYLGGSRVDEALAAEYIAKVMALKARLEEAALLGGP